ncbi:MAG: Mu-like prophage major head subunit gpT family protein, partial [Acidobacteriota bacterium]
LLTAAGQWVNTGSNYNAGTGPGWFLTGGLPGMKPLILQEAYKPDLVEKFDPKDERVFMNDEFVWGSWASYGAGYFLWPLIQASKAPLEEDGFNAAYDDFAARVLDSEVPQALLPTDLWVPTSLRSAAQRVVKAINLENGKSNTNYEAVKLHVVPYLANA